MEIIGKIIGTGLLLVHQPRNLVLKIIGKIIGTGLLLVHQPRKTSRNLVSTTIHNFRYEGHRSTALVLLLTKLWGVVFAADAALRVSDSYNSDLITGS